MNSLSLERLNKNTPTHWSLGLSLAVGRRIAPYVNLFVVCQGGFETWFVKAICLVCQTKVGDWIGLSGQKSSTTFSGSVESK